MNFDGSGEVEESFRDLYSDALAAIHREYEEFKDRGILPSSSISEDAMDRMTCLRRMLMTSWQQGSLESYRAIAVLFEAWDDRDQWLAACRFEAKAKAESKLSLASSSSSATATESKPTAKCGLCIVLQCVIFC